jgi:hypothetical protein
MEKIGMKEIDDELLEKAIKTTIENFPNSFIADMMKDFPIKFIVKFLMIYSGQSIKVPSVQVVWNKYRNKVILETLKEEDNKDSRKKLATYFGITTKKVANIFNYEKEKKPIREKKSEKNLNTSVTRTFNRHLKDAIQQTEETVYKKRRKSLC